MSNPDIFRSPSQELEKLTSEIAEIKLLLKEITARLNQIERHATRAFEPVSTAQRPKKSQQATGKPPSAQSSQQSKQKPESEQPSIDAKEALRLFDEFATMWKNGEGTQVEAKLNSMPIPDLKVMAHELGVTFRSKPSRKDLSVGIRGRISESVMLSKNVNTTQPRIVQQQLENESN